MNLSFRGSKERIMRKYISITVIFLYAATLLVGCDTALSVGGRTLGIQSGKFVFTDNALKRPYNFPIDQVSKACEMALKDLKATLTEREAGISSSSWTAVLHGDKVRIIAEYASKEMTFVSVNVGLSSNKTAALLIHDKIESALPKP
jgi:hypothetical protein